MKRWKLGIVGCGGAMLCIHLPVLQKYSHRFEVSSICDLDDTRLEIVSQRVKNVRIHKNIETLLRDDIDLVVILSPNHETFIEKSLYADKHVFTEKPISLDLRYSKQLKELAISRGLLLEVGLMRLYDKVVHDFFSEICSDSIVSVSLYKADGTDKHIRRAFLPQLLEIYNFDRVPPPITPKELNEKQVSILKVLLWSGIHLLTTLCQKFQTVYPVSCCCNQDASSVVCVFRTPMEQQFTFSISNTDSPVYLEGIRCVSKQHVGHLEFSSPYLLGGTTKSHIQRQHRNEDIFHFESPFYSMWDHIGHLLEHGNKNYLSSLDKAIQVEHLARKTAELCV